MKVLIFIPGLFGSTLCSAKTSKQVFPGTLYDLVMGKIRRRRRRKALVSAADSQSISGGVSYEVNDRNQDFRHTGSSFSVMNERDFNLLCDESLRPDDIVTRVFGISVYSSFISHIESATTFRRIYNVGEEEVKKLNGDILYCLPWNWVIGRDDGIQRLIMVMHQFQRIFSDLTVNGKVFFDGFILVGHSIGGCIATIAAERWMRTYGTDTKYANVLRAMCVGSPIFGTEKAISIIDGTCDGVNWFSGEQLLTLSHLPHSNILYELLPFAYLRENLHNTRLSHKKILSAMRYYDEIQVSGDVPMVFMYNKQKKTCTTGERVLMNVDKIPMDRETFELIIDQGDMKAQRQFQYLKKPDEFNRGDGSVEWKLICSKNCTTVVFNSRYSHTFLLNDRFILQQITNFVK